MKYNIPSDSTVRNWILKYTNGKRVDESRISQLASYEAVGISRSSYYKWLKRKPSKDEQELKQLKKNISEVYHQHKGIYGYRRITIYLNHYKNVKVNHKCVYRLMRLMGLKAVIRRRRYNYQPSKAIHVSENLMNDIDQYIHFFNTKRITLKMGLTIPS